MELVGSMRVEQLCVLGSTGSIGLSTLDVVRNHPDRYRVHTLIAGRNAELMAQQVREFRPSFVAMADEVALQTLRELLGSDAQGVELAFGESAMAQMASDASVDTVMAAIVGAAGLIPTLAAVNVGKKILLANKEVLVMTGALFMDAVKRSGATLLPIDSEHNAIFQCMPLDFQRSLERVGVRKILLTASGGPFRKIPLSDFAHITPEQACSHPNWNMGRKISVDSASMMNKGLELIEACWLFDARPDQIEVVIHPQSVIHSMVDYVDGSVLAQLGNPDMRTPIAHALAWPQRIDSGVAPLSITDIARLDFEAPDEQRFPNLTLARQSMQRGGTAPAILNAANELAVEAFLNRTLRFDRIAVVVSATLQSVAVQAADSLDAVLEADRLARVKAAAHIQHYQGAL